MKEIELKINELKKIEMGLELKFEKFIAHEQKLKLKVMNSIFAECLPEGYEIRSGHAQWSIDFINNHNKYGDEIMSFRTLKLYEPKSRHLLEQISISTYSTSSHSAYELNRYIIIGKIAEILKTRNDELILSLNTISIEQKELRGPTRTALRDIYIDISKNRKKLDLIIEVEKLEELSRGIENPGKIFFKTNKEEFQNISFIKAVAKPSGKTFDVEIECERSVWVAPSSYKKLTTNASFTVNRRRILDFIIAPKE